MEAFKVSNELSDLLESYPQASKLLDAALNGGEQSKIAIARLWLSEGIPFAFKNKPALYESVRGWLAIRLDIDPKEINLTGSARIGQSLAPDKIGQKFSDQSDLDIFIVSKDLFKRMKADFNKWSYQFESGVVKPRNEREKKFWVDNNYRCPKHIQRGFIDSKLVPNLPEYPMIKNISQTMWLLIEKLNVTENAPTVKSASVRCYKSWESYVRQMIISLS